MGLHPVPLNVAPPVLHSSGLPQHVAFSTYRILDLARVARDRELEFLTVADNYYDDLVARFDLGPKTVAQLHELGLLYDREAGGEFVHFYSATVGEVSFEVVSGGAVTTVMGPPTRPSGWRRSAQAGPVFTPEGAGREARPPGQTRCSLRPPPAAGASAAGTRRCGPARRPPPVHQATCGRTRSRSRSPNASTLEIGNVG
jgi:hypothetical protein